MAVPSHIVDCSDSTTARDSGAADGSHAHAQRAPAADAAAEAPRLVIRGKVHKTRRMAGSG